MNQPNIANETYMDRNGRWVRPLAFALILLMGSTTVGMYGVELPIPNWLITLGAAIGFFGAGILAAFTDTISALIARYLTQLVASVILGTMLWHFVNGPS